MNYIKFAILGVFFGILMIKSEIISWFRIYEMFQFHSFHMYGIIGSAVLLGAVGVALMKKWKTTAYNGESIVFIPKDFSVYRYLLGGIIFGLGWALVGACPGPIFVLLGAGYASFIVVLIGALLGTFAYGLLRSKLPH